MTQHKSFHALDLKSWKQSFRILCDLKWKCLHFDQLYSLHCIRICIFQQPGTLMPVKTSEKQDYLTVKVQVWKAKINNYFSVNSKTEIYSWLLKCSHTGHSKDRTRIPIPYIICRIQYKIFSSFIFQQVIFFKLWKTGFFFNSSTIVFPKFIGDLKGNLEENIDEPDEVEPVPSTSSDSTAKKRRRAKSALNKSPEEESNLQTERPQRARISETHRLLMISKSVLPKYQSEKPDEVRNWQLGSNELWYAKFNTQNMLHWQNPKSENKSILSNFCKASLTKNFSGFIYSYPVIEGLSFFTFDQIEKVLKPPKMYLRVGSFQFTVHNKTLKHDT